MKNTDQRLTRQDLWAIYRNQFFIRSCLNYERFQNVGFTHAMSPIIDKYYETPEEKQEIMDRHMQLFLTQPMVASIPIGVAAALEERLVVDKDIDADAINATKAGAGNEKLCLAYNYDKNRTGRAKNPNMLFFIRG